MNEEATIVRNKARLVANCWENSLKRHRVGVVLKQCFEWGPFLIQVESKWIRVLLSESFILIYKTP